MLKTLFTILCLALAVIPAAAQDSDNPSIAILRFGPLPNTDISEGAILDMLESYGFISTMENRLLEERARSRRRKPHSLLGRRRL